MSGRKEFLTDAAKVGFLMAQTISMAPRSENAQAYPGTHWEIDSSTSGLLAYRLAGKDRQRNWGLQAGRGGWSREVLTPSAGDDVDFCVAILGCHLNGKSNQLSQHLFPRKRRRLRVVAKPALVMSIEHQRRCESIWRKAAKSSF
jgi:hypothetical protein